MRSGCGPSHRVVNCNQQADGTLEVKLDVGETLTVDHVVLATGYRVDMNRIPYLCGGNVLKEMQISNGYPVLDEHFQSTVPGLFITSFSATQDFGPFFGFVIGSSAAARIIGSYLTTKKMGSA